MEQRRFGNSDLRARPWVLAPGKWAAGRRQLHEIRREIDYGEAVRAVHSALDAGVDLFDTAAIYGPYSSEELLAEALGPRRKDVVLVTKVGFDIDDDREVHGRNASRAIMLDQADKCLQRLEDRLRRPHDAPLARRQDSIAEIMGALEEIKAAGKARHYRHLQLQRADAPECQRYGRLDRRPGRLHLFDRRSRPRCCPTAARTGIGFMSYGSLGFGLCTGAFTPATRFVEWDWRSKGKAFGLPIFEERPSSRSCRSSSG